MSSGGGLSIMERIRALAETARAGNGPILAEVLRRKNQGGGPALLLPPPSVDEESSLSSSSSGVSISTAPSRKRKRGPPDVISTSFTVARPPASLEDRYIPFEEAVEAVQEISSFYNRRKVKNILENMAPENRCFLCEYGNTTFDSSPDYGCKPYVRLVNFIKQHYGQAFNTSIAINMFELYTKGIYEPALEYARRHSIPTADFPIPAMSVAMFQAHMEKMHTLNGVLMLGEGLREIEEVKELVKARIVNRENNNLNLTALAGYTKIMELKRKWMTTKPDQLLFNSAASGGMTLDPAKVGGMANLTRVETLLLKDGQTIGGQTAGDSHLTKGDANRTTFIAEDDDTDLAQLERDLNSFEEEDTVDPATRPDLDAMDIDGMDPPSSPLA